MSLGTTSSATRKHNPPYYHHLAFDLIPPDAPPSWCLRSHIMNYLILVCTIFAARASSQCNLASTSMNHKPISCSSRRNPSPTSCQVKFWLQMIRPPLTSSRLLLTFKLNPTSNLPALPSSPRQYFVSLVCHFMYGYRLFSPWF